MQWSEVMADKSLQNLPYKIELNEYGKIVMSPASNKHGFYQSEISALFCQQLPQGKTIIKCSIQTVKEVKVADVAWLSVEFLRQHSLNKTPFLAAPEICVEILSPGNSEQEMREKIQPYLQQGSQEVWLVDTTGNIRFFNATGENKQSAFGMQINLPIIAF